VFDPAIGKQPDQRGDHVDGFRDPRRNDGRGDCRDVEQRRQLALPIAADCPRQDRIRPLTRDDRLLEDVVGERGHQQHDAVERGGQGGEMVLAHPSRSERKQRQPEQQVQVRPERRAGDRAARVEHVMMIVPVDADEDEAQDVAEEDRQQRPQFVQAVAMRHPELQHHDRDDDRDHTIAERFQPSLAHPASLFPA
jgi:hypothetical protein